MELRATRVRETNGPRVDQWWSESDPSGRRKAIVDSVTVQFNIRSSGRLSRIYHCAPTARQPHVGGYYVCVSR